MTYLASLMNLAGPDMIVVFLIILVLFGAKRLPDLAKGMGQAVKEFQKAKSDFTQEFHPVANPDRPMEGQTVAIARTDPATAQPAIVYPSAPADHLQGDERGQGNPQFFTIESNRIGKNF